MTAILRKGECLHCAVRDLITDDILLHDTSTPTQQGGNLGQAIGDCVALDENPDTRYMMCVEVVASFAVAMCRAAKIPPHPAPQILFDAGKHCNDIVIIHKRG